jgi:hypothetical protein
MSACSTGFTTDGFGTLSCLNNGLEFMASPVGRLNVFVGISFFRIGETPPRYDMFAVPSFDHRIDRCLTEMAQPLVQLEQALASTVGYARTVGHDDKKSLIIRAPRA